jgi:hypothetical protein
MVNSAIHHPVIQKLSSLPSRFINKPVLSTVLPSLLTSLSSSPVLNSIMASSYSSSKSSSSSSFFLGRMDENSRYALFYCSLLALQFGLQPMIANKFTPKEVSKTSVVITTEIFKILVAGFSISSSSSAEWEKIRETWSISNSLKVAALPAALYAIQNICVQYGYVLLDSMTFNLLNQTKVTDCVYRFLPLCMLCFRFFVSLCIDGLTLFAFFVDNLRCCLVIFVNGTKTITSSMRCSSFIISFRLTLFCLFCSCSVLIFSCILRLVSYFLTLLFIASLILSCCLFLPSCFL